MLEGAIDNLTGPMVFIFKAITLEEQILKFPDRKN